MLMQQQGQEGKSSSIARRFFVLAFGYLALGLLFGFLGSMQYLLPDFLKEKLSFQKTRPLHVYLVIAWIFTAIQGCIYYLVTRIRNKKLYWEKGADLHFYLQLFTSLLIIASFFAGKFGGREYLEFPPWIGILVIGSWIPFAVNFFATLKPDYRNAPVYYFSWTVGIVFFFITLSESYLWIFDHFRNNIVRDVTVQWKALGSMVGSWNMLIYGSSIYIMCSISNDFSMARSRTVFFFFFLGFTNLLFNWGHHTYIVPAAPYVKDIAYLVSMTELLIFGQIVYKFRKTLSNTRKHYYNIPYRLFSFADIWIFLNLGIAIAISVPAVNRFTHGTHITVAHAMGATIGINTMLILGCMFHIMQEEGNKMKLWLAIGISITNIALVFFWISLLGSGLYKISGQLNSVSFSAIMKGLQPFFRMFAISGLFIMLGLGLVIFHGLRMSFRAPKPLQPVPFAAEKEDSLRA